MNVFSLGVLGPWQLIFVLLVLLIVGVVLLSINRTKHKSRAETLDEIVMKKADSSMERLNKLERLNAPRESGALSAEEYEMEKQRLLNS